MRDFLDWIAGENGWQLRFADSAVEQKSQTTILHGSIKGLTPEEALAAVLPTSGVDTGSKTAFCGSADRLEV